MELRGLTSVDPASLRPVYASLLDRQGDAGDLCKIRDGISEALFDRGILARVEIPVQNVEAGAVALEIIEARVANVTVRGNPGPAEAALERYAKKLRGMAPFDINRVQRYILLASDLPGIKIQASVRPSPSGERGAVDLDLVAQHDPQELIINAQNQQSKTTGRWGVLARSDFNGLTRRGERTTLVAYRTVRNEQWVVQGLEELHVSGEGAILRGSLAYGESRPGDVLKPLNLQSKSLVGNVELSQPLVRTRRRDISISGGVEVVNQSTEIPGAGTLFQDDVRTAYVRFDAGETLYLVGRPARITLQGALRRGLTGLGATRVDSKLKSRADGQPDSMVAYGQVNIVTQIVPGLAFVGEIDAQYSRRALLAYQQYSAGSLTIGRGYDPSFVSGDSALAASFEAHAGPYQPVAGVVISPYAFYDVAHVSNHGTRGLSDTLSSVGFGFQMPLRERWSLDVGYALPLDRREIDRARPQPRLLVNLTARFF